VALGHRGRAGNWGQYGSAIRPGQRQGAAQNGGRAQAAMSFFESEIVQDEAKRLFGDYQALMQLGSEYGKFDREGKKLFIERMETLMERYRVFMKRFELSEDFQAKLTVEQLRTQLNQFGITPEQMFDQMNNTLERMKTQLDQEPG
jgi:phosphoenolpyruvate carboxylase